MNWTLITTLLPCCKHLITAQNARKTASCESVPHLAHLAQMTVGINGSNTSVYIDEHQLLAWIPQTKHSIGHMEPCWDHPLGVLIQLVWYTTQFTPCLRLARRQHQQGRCESPCRKNRRCFGNKKLMHCAFVTLEVMRTHNFRNSFGVWVVLPKTCILTLINGWKEMKTLVLHRWIQGLFWLRTTFKEYWYFEEVLRF